MMNWKTACCPVCGVRCDCQYTPVKRCVTLTCNSCRKAFEIAEKPYFKGQENECYYDHAGPCTDRTMLCASCDRYKQWYTRSKFITHTRKEEEE